MFVIAENNSSLPQNLEVSFPKLSAWPAVINYTLLCFLKLHIQECAHKTFCLKAIATMPNLLRAVFAPTAHHRLLLGNTISYLSGV